MAWTAPRTWVTSELVTSTMMNTHVRDNLRATEVVAHTEFTADVVADATTEATATTIVTAPSVTFRAEPILIEFFCECVSFGDVGRAAYVFLFEDGASIGKIWEASNGNTFGTSGCRGARRLTPSAGAHVYSIRAYRSGGAAQFNAGAGGLGNKAPGFIRIKYEPVA